MRLEVIYDSHATNRKQGGLPVESPPPAAFLLVAWESYMTPSQQEYTTPPPQTAKTLYKKTVQHNVDDDILTKQCFPRALGYREEIGNWSDHCGSQ
jgi:hypothetical protein